MPINHDQLFKQLLTTFFLEFLELFFPEILPYLDRESLQFIDKELFTDITQGKQKVLDIVALAKFQEQNYSFLIHLENQASNQPDFNQRMFCYFCSLYLKYNFPIYPIVIFSYDTPNRPEKDNFVIDFPPYKVIQFNYKVVQLNRLNWRDFLKQKNPVAAALMAKMKIKESERVTVKLECLRLLTTLKLDPAKMQLISGFIDNYLRLNETEETIFQTQLSTMELKQQEEIMELTTSWSEKGLQQGLQQGKASTVLRLLNRRLGSLSPEITSQISALESDKLDELTEALLDFQTPNELIEWLHSRTAN
jgi:hypothetical protein